MSKKYYYFKSKRISLAKKRWYYVCKRHEKYTKTPEILLVAFTGGLYKVHVVMCSKLVELQGKSN